MHLKKTKIAKKNNILENRIKKAKFAKDTIMSETTHVRNHHIPTTAED